MVSQKQNGGIRYLPFAIIIGVLTVAVGVGLVMYSRRDETAKVPSDTLTAPPTGKSASPQTPQRRLPEDARGAQPPHVRGNADAPVTLEEFGDFECPPCGQLYPELKKIKSDMGSRLRVVFRHLPLVTMHKNALEAARASEAAGKQNRFWEMHDMLYEKQTDWAGAANARQIFVGYARTLALDADQFQRDLDSMEVNTRIRADVARADSLGITGTPSLILNDQPVSREQMLPASLRAAIETAAGSSGKGQ